MHCSHAFSEAATASLSTDVLDAATASTSTDVLDAATADVLECSDKVAACGLDFLGRIMSGRRVHDVTVSNMSCRLKQSLVISLMLWLTSWPEK